jgi:hypothetical protein
MMNNQRPPNSAQQPNHEVIKENTTYPLKSPPFLGIRHREPS